MLAQFPRHREELKVEAPRSVSVLWKRWAPGIPDSQIAGGGVLDDSAITSVCPKRRVGKEKIPTWMLQRYAFRQLITPMGRIPAALGPWPGDTITVLQYVARAGALNRQDIIGLETMQRNYGIRAKVLGKHAREREEHMHVVSDAIAPRAQCVWCKYCSYFTLSEAWMRQRCPESQGDTPHCILQELSRQEALAKERAAALHRLTH